MPRVRSRERESRSRPATHHDRAGGARKPANRRGPGSVELPGSCVLPWGPACRRLLLFAAARPRGLTAPLGRSGGIGRRARFRFWSRQLGGGSSPLFGTSLAAREREHFLDRGGRCSARLRRTPIGLSHRADAFFEQAFVGPLHARLRECVEQCIGRLHDGRQAVQRVAGASRRRGPGPSSRAGRRAPRAGRRRRAGRR